jgi:hypothetical protein
VPSTTRPALRNILPVALVFFRIGFTHINDIVEITCTTSNIFFATVSKNSTTTASNKIVPVLAFNDISAFSALTFINYYNFSCKRYHNNSLFGGGCEIRTHGPFRAFSFQD